MLLDVFRRHHPRQQMIQYCKAARPSGCIFAEAKLCATVFRLQKRRRRMVRDIREGN
jgi:hypothetical protein